MLDQPRPHGLAGVGAGDGGRKGHGAHSGKPAKAAAGITTGQKFVAPVAFKRNTHGSPLPLRVQGAGQSGQQIGLGIGRILKAEALKPHRSTGTFCGLVPSPGQQSTQRFCRYGADITPERTLLSSGKNTRGHKALNFACAQGKAVGFGLAHFLSRARAAALHKLLPQCLKRQRVQCQMVPHQYKNAPAALPHKHGPKGVAAFGIQPCNDVAHCLAQHGSLRNRFVNIATLEPNFLRFGQHGGVVGRKGHTQRFVICGQGLQPCLKGGCGHICAYFERQQHKKLLPVQGVGGNKMLGKGQEGYAFARGNRRVIYILGCRRGLFASFKQGANVCKTRLAQKIGRTERGYATAAQNTRDLNGLDGIAAIAEKIALFRHGQCGTGVQNLAPSIGQHLPGLTPRKPPACTAHALRQFLQQGRSIGHTARIVFQHNARCRPGHQRKACRKLAGPQLKPKPLYLQPWRGHRLKMRVRCQKFRHYVCRAIAAVLDGLPHLMGGVGHGGAVCLIFKPYAQGHGVDVKTGGAKFVLGFAQAHGHAKQQLLAPKAAAKGTPRQSHKTGQHASARIFGQNFKTLGGLRININTGHGPGTAGSPCGLVYRLYPWL